MMLQSWLTAFPDYKQDNIDYVAEGNKVITIYDASGTWKGDFMGMKPTGKSLKTRDVDIFTFNDAGKIASHRSIQNMGAVMASVGMPAPAAAAHAQAAPPEKK
jgi:predicted ester cyclase